MVLSILHDWSTFGRCPSPLDPSSCPHESSLAKSVRDAPSTASLRSIIRPLCGPFGTSSKKCFRTNGCTTLASQSAIQCACSAYKGSTTALGQVRTEDKFFKSLSMILSEMENDRIVHQNMESSRKLSVGFVCGIFRVTFSVFWPKNEPKLSLSVGFQFRRFNTPSCSSCGR